jgi:hypothetical protein
MCSPRAFVDARRVVEGSVYQVPMRRYIFPLHTVGLAYDIQPGGLRYRCPKHVKREKLESTNEIHDMKQKRVGLYTIHLDLVYRRR